VPEFSEARLELYRLRRGRPTAFATVQLALVSDFGTHRDERYPIVALRSDAVIGELRLMALYSEVTLQRRDVYDLSVSRDPALKLTTGI
jgi:hypothetical protein